MKRPRRPLPYCHFVPLWSRWQTCPHYNLPDSAPQLSRRVTATMYTAQPTLFYTWKTTHAQPTLRWASLDLEQRQADAQEEAKEEARTVLRVVEEVERLCSDRRWRKPCPPKR